ncbi:MULTISPECIES: phosphoribosylformimino-5-aminoimidazole carboxamide ribotide isomerase [unclassified Moritella]|uniref:phosphoribosylformimino-5-aminoimidazole carboxamide ribotide isomerase n=1 Tax=unclassified Moritella TaxID=2637987 RepID=UPI001BA48733|nr:MULTISPECIES: phosphoribosylformimino-5-aminoimidazole carboxamide ribotide isomerase [unclassified Moritella]QUM85499.1 phosphoribosylformimino-5-aminoimidazole carboxamide ribotide isomerase [Moritella sp. 28]QUM89713.1 phosphoribosylformimino-5-aminoimidazole carboxamide ribotide isomerase [Moritella sp. 36]
MTQFRPCIDLHQGKVKQIVGGSLNDQGAATNFISQYDAAYYADIYRQHDLRGGHVIALGPNNEIEVLKALEAWPQGLQFGGGVNLSNAAQYIAVGASHVIVTSYLFDGDEFSWEKLAQLKELIGKEHLILDLSCRKTAQGWNIATNRWQTITSTVINADTLAQLSEHCAEFLIHAADVEGLQNGIDQELVTLLGQHTRIPVTYAGGARSIDDLALVEQLSKGKVDLTIGSALDIFGGSGITLQQCIDWNKNH